jgi:hypothetical protein
MKKFSLLILLIATFFIASGVHVHALGAKVAPLLYEISLAKGEVKKGYIDISNPNDYETTFIVELESFRQINNTGELAFEAKPEYQQGIKFDYDEFTLGPRESLRLYFTADADKLPKGGVYATAFFRTLEAGAVPDSTSVQPSTRVGTLLLIENGGGGSKVAEVSELNAPFLQIGKSVKLNAKLKNVGSNNALAFFPKVTAKLQPYGSSKTKKTELIFPSIERETTLSLAGSYFGPLRAEVTAGSNQAYIWVFAITGWGRVLAAVLVIAIIIFVHLMMRRSKNKNLNKKSKKTTKTAKKIPINYQD